MPAAALAASTVAGDAAALAILARNLIDNALRYTPPGGEVLVSVVQRSECMLLRVEDSGPGIPTAERDRVFDRFVRGAQNGGNSGSGLGLAIVRAIAERHGAHVTLADAALGGLRVEVALPWQSAAG